MEIAMCRKVQKNNKNKYATSWPNLMLQLNTEYRVHKIRNDKVVESCITPVRDQGFNSASAAYELCDHNTFN